MPVIEIERVGAGAAPPGLAQALADAAGRVLGGAPGHTWVRLRTLDAACYAENEAAVDAQALPIFASVLLAHPPQGEAQAALLRALTDALAAALGCEPSRVHVQIAPAAAGRQAFGGRVVS